MSPTALMKRWCTTMNKSKKYNYVIIGNSAGGINAAEAIREVDRDGSLAIVSDEAFHAYSRPMIADYLAGKCSLEKMLYRPADYYEKNSLQVIQGIKVLKLDIAAQSIQLENGETISWERLLLATGGQPIIPSIQGINHRGVFSFITLNDAKSIRNYIDQRVQQAVVIGGGLIGVSVTEALAELGIKVVIVEMKERLLNTMLDVETSIMVEAKLAKAGIKMLTGHTVVGIDGSAEIPVTGVITGDGTVIPCQMVIVAIGVQPRAGLAAEAGLKVGRGIIVDRNMATSAPGVYACGDASEAFDFIFRQNRLTPVWPNACLGGRVAGFNMAGVTTEYPGGTSMNSLKYFGLSIVSAGTVIPLDESYEVLSSKWESNYRKIVLKDGLIAGMLFVGDIEKAGIVYNLMKNRVKVDAFKRALLDDDFSLTCLPDEIWRPSIEVPSWLADIPVTASVLSEEMAGGD